MKNRTENDMAKKESKIYVDSFIPFENSYRRDYPEGIVCATEHQHGGEATLILSGVWLILPEKRSVI